MHEGCAQRGGVAIIGARITVPGLLFLPSFSATKKTMFYCNESNTGLIFRAHAALVARSFSVENLSRDQGCGKGSMRCGTFIVSLPRLRLFSFLSSSTGLGNCTWSVNTVMSKAIEGKGWRWSRTNHMKTRSTAKDSSQRNESTSTGWWTESQFICDNTWLQLFVYLFILEHGILLGFFLPSKQQKEEKNHSNQSFKNKMSKMRGTLKDNKRICTDLESTDHMTGKLLRLIFNFYWENAWFFSPK